MLALPSGSLVEWLNIGRSLANSIGSNRDVIDCLAYPSSDTHDEMSIGGSEIHTCDCVTIHGLPQVGGKLHQSQPIGLVVVCLSCLSLD